MGFNLVLINIYANARIWWNAVISFIKVPSIWAFGALLDTVKRAISGSSGMIVCAREKQRPCKASSTNGCRCSTGCFPCNIHAHLKFAARWHCTFKVVQWWLNKEIQGGGWFIWPTSTYSLSVTDILGFPKLIILSSNYRFVFMFKYCGHLKKMRINIIIVWMEE